MGKPAEDIVGQRFGRWLVTARVPRAKGDRKSPTFWACRCDCGKTGVVDAGHLRRGGSQSCGCLSRQRTSEWNKTRVWPSSLERFESKIEKLACEAGCWIWMGALNMPSSNPRAYGHLKLAKGFVLAHRVAWELYRGPIPDDLCVLHKCDVPLCVNPEHLFLGTLSDNMQDMIAKGRDRASVHPESYHNTRRRKQVAA